MPIRIKVTAILACFAAFLLAVATYMAPLPISIWILVAANVFMMTAAAIIIIPKWTRSNE